MTIARIALSTRGSVLTGSQTTTKIDVNEVEVEEYKNGMAGDAPFEIISFD